MYTIPSAAELDAMRSATLKALDVRQEVLLRAARTALSSGRSVNLTCNGEVIGRLHPNGYSEIFLR